MVTESCTSDSGLRDLQRLDMYGSDDIWKENLLGGKLSSSVKTCSTSDFKYLFLASVPFSHQVYRISDFPSMFNSGEGHYKNAQTVHNSPSPLQLISHLSCNASQEDTTPSVMNMKNVVPLSLSSPKTFESEDINLPAKDFSYQESTSSLLVTNHHPETEGSTGSALVPSCTHNTEGNADLVWPLSSIPHLGTKSDTGCFLDQLARQYLDTKKSVGSELDLVSNQNFEIIGSGGCVSDLASKNFETEESTGCFLDRLSGQKFENEINTGCFLDQLANKSFKSEKSTGCFLDQIANQHLETERSIGCFLDQLASQHLDTEGNAGCSLNELLDQHCKIEETPFVECSSQNVLSGDRLYDQYIWNEQDDFKREFKYPETNVQEDVKSITLPFSEINKVQKNSSGKNLQTIVTNNASAADIYGCDEYNVCALCKTKDWTKFQEEHSHCNTNADLLLHCKNRKDDSMIQLPPMSECSFPSTLQLNTCSVFTGKNTNLLNKVLDSDALFEKPSKQLLPDCSGLNMYQSGKCDASNKSFGENGNKFLIEEDIIDLALALKKEKKTSLPKRFESQRNDKDLVKSIEERIIPPSDLNIEEYNYQSYHCLDSLLCCDFEATLRPPTLKADPSMFACTLYLGKGFSQFTKPYSYRELLKEVTNYRRIILDSFEANGNSGCHYRENVVTEEPKVFHIGNSVSRLKFEPNKEVVAVGHETKELSSDVEENNISGLRTEQPNTNTSGEGGSLQFKQFTSSEPDNYECLSTCTPVTVTEGVTSKLNRKSTETDRNCAVKYVEEDGLIKSLINLVVIGPAGAGKSMLVEHFLSRNHGVTMETAQLQFKAPAMDIAQTKFETSSGLITLLDLSGHRDSIVNIISGAFRIDGAILVFDATKKYFEMGFDAVGQTVEQAFFIKSLGVLQLAVAVNKLDVMDWAQEQYELIITKLGVLLKQAGFEEKDVAYVPCSGLTGENLTGPAKQEKLTTWYKGPCLADVIGSTKLPLCCVSKPLRLSIDETCKITGSDFCVVGKVEAGNLQNGDTVLVMPAGEELVIKGLMLSGFPVSQVSDGDHVVVKLTSTDITKVTSGSIICDPNQPIKMVTRFQASLVLFDIQDPISEGLPVVLHYRNLLEQAVIYKFVSQLHRNMEQIVENTSRCLTQNICATVEVSVNRPVCLELYKDCKKLGWFRLCYEGVTFAVGMVTEIL